MIRSHAWILAVVLSSAIGVSAQPQQAQTQTPPRIVFTFDQALHSKVRQAIILK